MLNLFFIASISLALGTHIGQGTFGGWDYFGVFCVILNVAAISSQLKKAAMLDEIFKIAEKAGEDKSEKT